MEAGASTLNPGEKETKRETEYSLSMAELSGVTDDTASTLRNQLESTNRRQPLGGAGAHPVGAGTRRPQPPERGSAQGGATNQARQTIAQLGETLEVLVSVHGLIQRGRPSRPPAAVSG